MLVAHKTPRVVRIERDDGAYCSNQGCESYGHGPWFDVVVEGRPSDAATRPMYGDCAFFRFCFQCVGRLIRYRTIPPNVERKRRLNGVALTVKVYAPSAATGNECAFRHAPGPGVKRVALHSRAGMNIICVPCLEMLSRALVGVDAREDTVQ